MVGSMNRTCPITEDVCTKKLDYDSKSGFLMISYKEEQFIDVEDAIKNFFTEKGYRIIVARDEPKLSSLFCKICGQIQCCGFGICVLSDPRPNVFFELGLCFGLGKQVIILGKEGMELPSDISNIEYYTFGTLRDLNAQLEKIENNLLVGKKPDQDSFDMITLRKAMNLLSELLDKEGISRDIVDSDEHKEIESSSAEKFDSLIDYINQKIENVADPSRYYLQTGKYSFNIYDYDRALFYYQKALESDPNNVVALTSIGKCYYYNGNLEKAITYYKKAIEVDKDFVYPYNNLGIIYDDKEKYDKAIMYYKRAISIDPDYPNPYNNIGSIFTLRKEYDAACEWYLKSLEIDSNFWIARLNLIENYCLLNKLRKGRKEINVLMKNKRIDPEIRYLTYFFSILIFLLDHNSEKVRKDLDNFIRYYKKHGVVEIEWLFEDIQPGIENLNEKEKELMCGFISVLQGNNDFEQFEHLSGPFRS
jgi:tetratricopeptide (TPR) repeat protein